MLMVVFGAGASHDSIDVKPPGADHPGWIIEEQFRPPLAKDLFAFTELFAKAMAMFEKLQPIVPILRRTGGKNVETVLRELQDEAEVYPERHCQLMAVRYYLHTALWECESKWKIASKNVTNYKALLDQINRWRRPDEAVCLVTFNYDTLLEDATPAVGLTIAKLEDYISGNPSYKVFKLHGSVNWARGVATPSPYAKGGQVSGNAWSVAWNHIERAASLDITDQFVRIDQYPVGLFEERIGLVPAIAIPVEKKTDFECPQSHLNELKRLLPQVDRLLLIGWRATEDHFLTLLRDNLKGPLLAQVVAGAENEARNIARSLQDGPFSGLTVRWEYAPAGFTDFVVNRRAETILSRSAST
jgi:SIR2-like protein